jgi:hypothetical protein
MVDRIQADGAITQVAQTTIIPREDLAAVPAPQNAELRHRAITSSSRVLTTAREGVDLVPHISGIDHLIRDMKALSSNELLNKKLDQILAKIFPAYGAMKAGHVEPALQKAADAAISELRGIAASSMLFADVPGDAIPSSSDNMNIKVYNSDDPLQRMDEALKQIAQMRESMANEDAQRYQRMLSTNQQTDARVSANQQSAAQLGTKAIAAISSQAQQALHAHAGLSADMTLMLLN